MRNGSTAHVRQVHPDDAEALRSFLDRLSPESRRLRFFTGAADVESAARWAAGASGRHGVGLVATVGDPPVVVGHAGYERNGAGSAEIAFEVADSLRGRGLATTLMAHLAGAARENGIERFVAEVLPENRRMLEVFSESGFPTRVDRDRDGLHVSLGTELTEEALERYATREAEAAGAAVRHFLEPESVAVVGASRRPGSVGDAVLRNVIRSGFDGPIFPVNHRARRVQGLRAYPSVAKLPQVPELAVLATPAEAVVDVARECALKGVPALLVLSAGFAESGAEGARLQEELVAICRAAGMRLVGPNCLGVMGATRPIDATFSPHAPPEGGVALLSQSGGVGLALIEESAALGLGLSSFVSIGNRPDVSANDVLEYWEGDDSTRVVLLYLESFGNPRNFGRIARRLGARKPVVAVSAGRSRAGARAAASHTGAAIGASDKAVEALFRHAGVVRAGTLGELFEVAALLESQPLPRGRRVGIVTNAGGPAILCADACQAGGLELPELSEALQRKLAARLPPHGAATNPIDMLAAAGPDEFATSLAALAKSGEVDALIAIFAPVLEASAAEVGDVVAEASRGIEIPVLAVLFGGGEVGGLPVYRYPESAARALARVVDHVEWRQQPRGELRALTGVRQGEAASLLAFAAAGGGRWLEPGEVLRLLACWGLPLTESQEAAGPAQAGRAAVSIGGKVALKGVAQGLLHKTDAGAVELGLEGEQDVARAARRMARRLRGRGYPPSGFIVQHQVDTGVEMLAGISVDPALGPMVACGAGGTTVELLADVAVRLAPLTDLDAARMVRSLATFPLLDGYRGAPKADVGALEEVLTRLGALADAHPEVAELDCNPVVVGRRGAFIADARVRVAAPAPPRPWPAIGAEPPSTAR